MKSPEKKLDKKLVVAVLAASAFALAGCVDSTQSKCENTQPYKDGYAAGQVSGAAEGKAAALALDADDGYNEGYQKAYVAYKNVAYENAYDIAYDDAFDVGKNSFDAAIKGASQGTHDGIQEGYGDGSDAGSVEGEEDGYNAGYSDGSVIGYDFAVNTYCGFAESDDPTPATCRSLGESNGRTSGYSSAYAQYKFDAVLNADFVAGYNNGYSAGAVKGAQDGALEGALDGSVDGEIAGYNYRYELEYEIAYQNNYDGSYLNGYNDAYAFAYDMGYGHLPADPLNYPYEGTGGVGIGFSDGYDEGLAACGFVDGNKAPSKDMGARIVMKASAKAEKSRLETASVLKRAAKTDIAKKVKATQEGAQAKARAKMVSKLDSTQAGELIKEEYSEGAYGALKARLDQFQSEMKELEKAAASAQSKAKK